MHHYSRLSQSIHFVLSPVPGRGQPGKNGTGRAPIEKERNPGVAQPRADKIGRNPTEKERNREKTKNPCNRLVAGIFHRKRAPGIPFLNQRIPQAGGPTVQQSRPPRPRINRISESRICAAPSTTRVADSAPSASNPDPRDASRRPTSHGPYPSDSPCR